MNSFLWYGVYVVSHLPKLSIPAYGVHVYVWLRKMCSCCKYLPSTPSALEERFFYIFGKMRDWLQNTTIHHPHRTSPPFFTLCDHHWSPSLHRSSDLSNKSARVHLEPSENCRNADYTVIQFQLEYSRISCYTQLVTLVLSALAVQCCADWFSFRLFIDTFRTVVVCRPICVHDIVNRFWQRPCISEAVKPFYIPLPQSRSSVPTLYVSWPRVNQQDSRSNYRSANGVTARCTPCQCILSCALWTGWTDVCRPNPG